jgi:methylase of polypeptide subunit release factors
MDQDVILHEPALALYGGIKTGFELYEKLISQCFELKKSHNIKNLFLFIEIGFDQKNISTNYLENKKLQFEMFKDN